MTTVKTVIEVVPAADEASPFATCPLCHTVDTTLTRDALAAGATWRCSRCGQMWSADRLDTAAAYARTQAGTSTQLM